jgi:hypothetical protein
MWFDLENKCTRKTFQECNTGVSFLSRIVMSNVRTLKRKKLRIGSRMVKESIC